jgi:hypothetical protein
MDQHLLWQRVNKLITAQKELDGFLFQQKHIVAELVLRVNHLYKVNNISEEDFNEFKKEFLAKHEAAKANTKSSSLQSETPRPYVIYDEDSGQELSGKASDGVHK